MPRTDYRQGVAPCYGERIMTFSRLHRAAILVSVLALSACNSQPPPAPAPSSPPVPATNAVAAPAAPAKPLITKLDDLPRHTYPVTGPVADIVTQPDKFEALAQQVRRDTENDLATYDIRDKTTLRSLKGTLLLLDLIENKNDEARQLIGEVRALEDKPAAKLFTGVVSEARLDTMAKTGSSNFADPAFQKAYQAELEQRVAALPWNVVRDEVKSAHGHAQTGNRAIIMGIIASEIQPAVDKTGNLSGDLAGSLIGFRSALTISIPLKDPTAAALGAVIAKNNVAKADIWKDRDVALTAADHGRPVVIGIWDSGVDPTVYPHKLYEVPPGTKLPAYPDYQPNPNGFAFDLHSNPVHGPLYPLGDAASRVPQLRSQIKGILDLQAAVDSPEADAIRQKISSLKQPEVKPFLEDMDLYGNYIHGTHVAGIASKGNPFARILIGRITFDYHLIPEKPTVEQAKKDALADQAAVDFFKANHVRVVNMSWGGSLKDVEDALEENGVGDAAERKKEAREIFDIGRDGLYQALKSAPDILFVDAAGNSDNDVNFDEVIPSSFDLPNMMTIGATDQAGDETSFTSFGKNVAAYADGFEVESPIPGGTLLKLSGTSMASPEVANLAAKLFALDPALKPGDVIDLIHLGLEANPRDPRIHLINPRKSVGVLKDRLSGK